MSIVDYAFIALVYGMGLLGTVMSIAWVTAAIRKRKGEQLMNPKKVMIDLARAGNASKDKNFAQATGVSMTSINFCPWCEDRIRYTSDWDGGDYRLGKCPHCEQTILLLHLPFGPFGSFGATALKFERKITWNWKLCQNAGICTPIDIDKKEDK